VPIFRSQGSHPPTETTTFRFTETGPTRTLVVLSRDGTAQTEQKAWWEGSTSYALPRRVKLEEYFTL
jgi:hypothetical protein